MQFGRTVNLQYGNFIELWKMAWIMNQGFHYAISYHLCGLRVKVTSQEFIKSALKKIPKKNQQPKPANPPIFKKYTIKS
jgi:hypothetical protein